MTSEDRRGALRAEPWSRVNIVIAPSLFYVGLWLALPC
jgi:hypothetical protein